MNKANRESNDSRRSVRFRDEPETHLHHHHKGDDGTLPDESSLTLIESSEETVGNLVDVAYYETLMADKEPWIDVNYISGFRSLFARDEVWIKESSSFPCGLDSKYSILSKYDEVIYEITKTQRFIPTWLKCFCFFPFASFRNGFTLTMYQPNGSFLVKFRRNFHFHATQLDIVETFYGAEEMYVGRIERSSQGYILRDKNHEDIYRVLRLPTTRNSVRRASHRTMEILATMGYDDIYNTRKKCCIHCKCCGLVHQEMKIFRTDTKEPVGRVIYSQQGPAGRLFSGCLKLPLMGFKITPDVGTNVKILLIGALFFLKHCGNEQFSPLPLGSDAVDNNVADADSLISVNSNSVSSIINKDGSVR